VSDQALAELYKAQPSARAHIQKAAGYAVFSNFGLKILVAGRQRAWHRRRQQDEEGNLHEDGEVQAGLGFGVKNFRLVWVFDKKSDLDRFINSGWELGAQSTASAKVAGQGASVFAAPCR